MKTEDIKYKALKFAIKAHDGQKRKYTGEPYVLHPMAVYELGMEAGFDVLQLCACLLHDVVEDTRWTIRQIESVFGEEISFLVEQLTDVHTTEKSVLNRKGRKYWERKRISSISATAKHIKIADLIDNSRTIIKHDPEFAKVYMEEMRDLLPVLSICRGTLIDMAEKIVYDFFNNPCPTCKGTGKI